MSIKEDVENNFDLILKDFREGISLTKIMKKYKIRSSKYLWGAFKERNIETYPKLYEGPLTQLQIDNLTGLMLGDGHLSKPHKKEQTSGLRVTRSKIDSDYLENQHEIFENFCIAKVKYYDAFDKRTKKFYSRGFFNTRICKQFGYFRNLWYPQNIKIVPQNLALNDTIIYNWFCDDGCVIKEKTSITTKFATHGFQKSDVEFLKELLNNYLGSKFRISREMQKNGKEVYYLSGSTNSSKILINKLEPLFSNGIMLRKATWRNFKNSSPS